MSKIQQGFKRYFINTSWRLGEKIIRLIVSLTVIVWVIRYLGPEQFGLISYAQAYVGLFGIIATLGLDMIVIRELVKNDSKRDVLLGTAFRLKLIGAFCLFLLIAISTHFTSNDYYTNMLIFIFASGTIFLSFNVIDMYFHSKVLSKYVVFANLISLSLSSILKIVLILYKAPLIAFVLAIMFDHFVLTLGIIYFYSQNNLSPKSWKYDKKVAISLLKDSWPLVLTGIAVSFYMKIDQVMIREMLGNNAVGQYSAAVRLSAAWYVIPFVITYSLFPAIINAKAKSAELYYGRLQRLFDLMIWIAIIFALPMTFLSDWLVNILYGAQYDQVAGVLIIHIWAGVFVALGMASSKWVISENYLKNALIRTAAGAILNAILNYFLIKSFGIRGAAASTLITYVFVNYVSLLFYKKTVICFIMQSKALNIFRSGFNLIFKKIH